MPESIGYFNVISKSNFQGHSSLSVFKTTKPFITLNWHGCLTLDGFTSKTNSNALIRVRTTQIPHTAT